MSTPTSDQVPAPRAAALRELAGVLLLLTGCGGLVAAGFVVAPALGVAVLSVMLVGVGVLLASPTRGEG